MKKIITLFFTFFLLACLTGCSLNIFKKTTKKDTSITIGYVVDNKKVYKTYNSYNEVEFIDYETKTGYEFVGWSEDKERIVTKEALNGKSEVTLYPITKLINYRIIYDLDGGTNNVDNPSTYTIEDEIILKVPSKKYFAFTGWTSETITTPTLDYKINKGSYGDINVKANYINGMVNVVFDYPGIDVQTIEYNTKCTKPADPEKTGDEFLYWCSDETLKNEFDFDTLIKTNITLYPRWKNTEFHELTINNSSYVRSNYSNGELLPKNVSITLETDYIFENKEFVGWYIDGVLYSKENKITYKMPESNVEITPTFSSIETYSYTKGSGTDLQIPFVTSKLELFGSNIKSSNYSYNGSKITFYSSYLNSLNVGLNSFICNRSYLIHVFIKSNETKVSGINIDYDINYPYATLTFDQIDGLEYSYSLDENSYVDCNSNCTILINDKCSNHVLDIKCGSAVTRYYIEAVPVDANAYLEKTFTYQGNTYDYYIDSEEDLKILFEYATQAEYPSRGGLNYNFRFYYSDGDNQAIAKPMYKKITNSLMSIPYGLAYSCNYASKIVSMTLSSEGYFNTEVTGQVRKDITTTYFKESNRSATFDNFYIENCTKTQEVRSIYELENLNVGVKPIIVDNKANVLYQKAKEILRKYVDDSFTIYEKLQAIYDYLGSYVTYDDELLKKSSETQSRYQSFTSYSALVNGIAVCDGIASAFKLLCTIEGIECIEVIGCAKNTGHAWNKVKIGNVWYGVDATWSRTEIGDDIYIKHTYFLVDEITLISFGDSYHFEQGTISGGYVYDVNIDKTANCNMNYYDLMLYGEYDLVVSSIIEFNSMTNYFVLNNIDYIELKLEGITHESISSLYYDIYYNPSAEEYIYLIRK